MQPRFGSIPQSGQGSGQELTTLEKGFHLPVPVLFAGTEHAGMRFLEFFTVNIRNPNTRRAYHGAIGRFARWCESHGITELHRILPVHIAAYIEDLLRSQSRPSAKQHLAAIRMLMDWLVVGQVLPWNPAAAVRGPRHQVRKGKTPVLSSEEARTLLDSIEITSVAGLRDRALIALMTYTFARVGAAIGMRVEDCYVQGRRSWVRLHEKGGKRTEIPAHHNLAEYIEQYIAFAGIAQDPKGPLFRGARGRKGELGSEGLGQSDVYRMIRRRAKSAGISTQVGCHTFRATGITAYLKNGGRLEIAQQMAGHESSRTTGLYDRRGDEIALDEVERIRI
jgi:site-specific recombinase XerD